MTNKYEWGENPIKDFFIQNIIDDIDISKKKNFEDIQYNLSMFIQHFLENENDVVYLNFSIKKDKFGGFNVVANNIITALWFSGIVPRDTDSVLNKNTLVYDNLEYRFNNKTKILTTKKLK